MSAPKTITSITRIATGLPGVGKAQLDARLLLTPFIVGTEPIDEAEEVSATNALVVHFSHPMNHTQTSITLVTDAEPQVPVVLTITWDKEHKNAMLAHPTLLSETAYILAVTGLTKDGLYSMTTTIGFTVTDIVPLTISLSDPEDGDMGVETGDGTDATPLIITFSEAVDTDTFEGELTIDETPVTTVDEWTSGDTILTIQPSAILTPETLYTYTITAAEDTHGNDIADLPVEISFTTEDAPEILSTVPDTDDVDVAIDTDIVLTFSRAMVTASLAVVVAPSPGGESPVWTEGDTVCTISHTDFANSTHYTVTIDADDTHGNTMETDEFEFDTIAV